MGLSDKQLKEFAGYLMPEKKQTSAIKINATVHSIDTTGDDPIYYVNFDGAEGVEPCPVSSTLGEQVLNTGDRVAVLVQDREGTIVGNISKPSDSTLISIIDDSMKSAGAQWLISASNATPPSPDDPEWSTIIPVPTAAKPYLWQKSGDVIQLSTVMNGLYTFMNAAMSGQGATVINGGAIDTSSITAEKLHLTDTLVVDEGLLVAYDGDTPFKSSLKIANGETDLQGWNTIISGKAVSIFGTEGVHFGSEDVPTDVYIEGTLHADGIPRVGTNYFSIGGYKICWGSEDINMYGTEHGSGTFTSPYYVDRAVSFPVSYSATPRIFLTVNYGATGSQYAYAINRSASGFSIRLATSHASTSVARTVTWLSIGS